MLWPVFVAAQAALFTPFVQSAQTFPPTARATKCNGFSDLCTKSYGAVTFVGAHHGYAVGAGDTGANQDQSLETQLNDGIRVLHVETHNSSDGIHLCHDDCQWHEDGSFTSYLTSVKKWLDSNPEEVLTILIANRENLPATSYAEMYKSVGLDKVSYTPDVDIVALSKWPTLASMIDSGKRLVTFLDNEADYSVAPWLLDEFNNMWETSPGVTLTSGFDCNVNHTKGDPANEMYLINHYLNKDVSGHLSSDIAHASEINAVSGEGSLGAHAKACNTTKARPPNFMLVDFYEYGGGSVFQVAADMNGVTYTKPPTLAAPVPTASSTSVSGSGSGNGAVLLSISWSVWVTPVVFGVLLGRL